MYWFTYLFNFYVDNDRDFSHIRLAIYEKTKDMAPAQLTEYYKKSTEATIKKYGFKVISSAKEK